jgi:hypothetical protein
MLAPQTNNALIECRPGGSTPLDPYKAAQLELDMTVPAGGRHRAPASQASRWLSVFMYAGINAYIAMAGCPSRPASPGRHNPAKIKSA